MKKAISVFLPAILLCLLLAACAGEEGETTEKPKVYTPYALEEPFITNVRESKKYLRCNITLETSNAEDVAENGVFVTKEYKIYDTINRILGQLTMDEVESENIMDLLSVRIVNGLNEALEIESVSACYFKQFVIQ